MKLDIVNCKNIDSASIELVEGKLNIKYAMNGTGKSTLAAALQAFVENSGDTAALVPFKHRSVKLDASNSPRVSGHDAIASIAVFNEEYMSQFTFQQDELLTNSFDVFVRTPDYEARMNQIGTLMRDINSTFKNSEGISRLLGTFTAFIDSYGKAESGYHAAGALAKGIGGGNKLEHIPAGLDGFKDYLRSDKKLPWLSWQIKGTDYLGLSDQCPFCTNKIAANRETIERVKVEFNPKSVEHLLSVLNTFTDLAKYLSDDTRLRVNELYHRPTALRSEETRYLVEVKEHVEMFRTKLIALTDLSYFSLKDVERVVDRLKDLKIDLTYIAHLRSADTESIATIINETLDRAIATAGQLQGEINKQRRAIEITVATHSNEINSFLANAGYKYEVLFEAIDDRYRLRLRHLEYDQSLSRGNQFLSYGERNAFALVLFMYEALSKDVNLVVLDDPISSFDRNKKFALIDMLFIRERSLRNRTVLMLTHDFEPIVDMLYTFHRRFSGSVVATFLSENGGALTEQAITRQDIKSVTDICAENVAKRAEPIVKLIHLRRYFEIVGDRGLPYELLSNLFHKRATPQQVVNGQMVPLSPEEIAAASSSIRQHLADFDYNVQLSRVNNVKLMRSLYEQTESNYEKLQLFRTIIVGTTIEDNVLMKYINETFHIENDYLMQLNPCVFQTTPGFVVARCDEELRKAV